MLSPLARASLLVAPALDSMAAADSQPDHILYDGTCALCHGAVKFAMKRDPSGSEFRFAPLQGSTCQTLIDPARRAQIPDSFVVLKNSGELLIRSDAAVQILRRIGGGWRALGNIVAIVPRPIRDAAYNAVAAVRYRIFGRKDDLCPVMTPDQRRRFDP
ncbi:MAG: DCC1-like thiol-disulfide oxidoreductase family protein [Candidatus Acidiferrales bacterium]